MDDLFAAASVACAVLWACAAALRAAPGVPQSVVRVASAVSAWRAYFIALFAITVFRAALFEMFWIPSASMQPSLREGEFVIVDKSEYGIRVPLLGMRVGGGEDPRRGEIVVFRYPGQEEVFYIKRIVGLPGDTLSIDGNLLVLDGDTAEYLGPAPEAYVYEEGTRGGLFGAVYDWVAGDKRQVGSELYWERLGEGWHPVLYEDSRVAPAAVLLEDGCEQMFGGRILTCRIPEGHYFVMGDNRHRSNDSRFWGFVPRTHLVGPAFTLAVSFDSFSRSFSSIGLTAEAAPIDGHAPPAAGE